MCYQVVMLARMWLKDNISHHITLEYVPGLSRFSLSIVQVVKLQHVVRFPYFIRLLSPAKQSKYVHYVNVVYWKEWRVTVSTGYLLWQQQDGEENTKKKKTVSYNKVSLSPFNESVTFHAHTSQCIHPASQRGLYRRGQLVMHNLNNTNTVLWLMWQ